MKTLPVFKPMLFLLAVLALWLPWNETQAQPATNAPPTAAVEARTKTPEPAIWLTFGLDRIELLQHRPFADIPIWQFLASFIYIFLSFYISKFLDYFIRGQALRWASKTSSKVDDLLLDLVRGPIKIVAFVILLHIGMRVYEWPEVLAEFFSKALKIIVACSITYVVIKAIDLIVGLWHQNHATPENEQFSKQLLPLIRKSLKVFVVIVAALVTSQNLGLNVTGLIASLSIGGLALGLAAQDTLSNLFGAVAILADKPFHVGDRILLDNIDGNVESIGFRSTRVRNQDGHLVTIPNKTMGNATITNVTRRPNIKTTMNIGITYATSAEKVKRAADILEEIFRPHPMTADLQIFFNRFDSSAMNIQLVHWWKSTDFKAYASGIQELNLEVKRRFDAEGIDFAFPSQTVYLKRDPKVSPFDRAANGEPVSGNSLSPAPSPSERP